MISIYFATGIFCSIATGLNYIKRRNGALSYPVIETGILYLATRIFPILMLEERTLSVYGNLLFDFLIFLALTHMFSKSEENKRISNISIVYLCNPIMILDIVSGQLVWMMLAVVMIILIIFFGKLYQQKLENLHAADFYPEYIWCMIQIFAALVAIQYKQQRIQDLFAKDTIPVLLILAVAGLIFGVISVFKKLLTGTGCIFSGEKSGGKKSGSEKSSGEKSSGEKFSGEKFSGKKSSGEKKGYTRTAAAANPSKGDKTEQRFSKWDLICMLVLTFVYACLVFFQLGSHTAPETGLRLTTEESGANQIVLDFGENVTISKLSIYLGYESGRSISFSYMDENTREWVIFDSNHEVKAAFDWNDVDVNLTIRELGIVSMDSEAYIHEIVILDGDGNPILPENVKDYESVFDEQSDWPEYTTYYYRAMFDEIYHGRTAYEFVHDLPIYEVTHPPLGKSIIALGIRLFGMTPFGWRFMVAVCGILMVPFAYLFAFRISRKTRFAFWMTALLCLDFMHYTLSRIATIDVIVAFFILLMFYFMYSFWDDRRRGKSLKMQSLWLLFCGLATGCAIATKWTGIYAAMGIGVIFFTFLIAEQKKNGFAIKPLVKLGLICLICFVAIPGVVYLLSYRPFLDVDSSKSLLQTAIENGKGMLSYHKNVMADHPYASPWYTWLVDGKSLLDALTVTTAGKASTIVTFGNPAIWWSGLLALLYNIYLWRCKKNHTAQFLVLAYLSMLLPWLLVHRTVFIYQYFVDAVLLVFLLGNGLMEMKKYKNMIWWVLLGISAILFILYFPVISGMPVNIDFTNQFLEWFTTWRFL